MSTILMTKQWKQETTKSLVEENQETNGKKPSKCDETQNSNFSAKDLMGLSWVLFENIENDIK